MCRYKYLVNKNKCRNGRLFILNVCNIVYNVVIYLPFPRRVFYSHLETWKMAKDRKKIGNKCDKQQVGICQYYLYT